MISSKKLFELVINNNYEELEIVIQNKQVDFIAENKRGVYVIPTKENFNKLKQTLGKVQILVLIKKLSESRGCDDVINSLLSVLNTNFESVNNILTSNLTLIKVHFQLFNYS